MCRIYGTFKAGKVERRLTPLTLIDYYYFENPTGEILGPAHSFVEIWS